MPRICASLPVMRARWSRFRRSILNSSSSSLRIYSPKAHPFRKPPSALRGCCAIRCRRKKWTRFSKTVCSRNWCRNRYGYRLPACRWKACKPISATSIRRSSPISYRGFPPTLPRACSWPCRRNCAMPWCSDAGPLKAHHGQIANIFNQLDRSEMEKLMASLQDLNRDDLNRIKAKLFTFEDIERLSQRARLLLFDEVQTEQIATALREADPKLQELVLSSLSARGRRMVESELSAEQGNITSQNIAEARCIIARIAIDLSERGIITLDATPET
ncbi:flagellar motor switch protein G [Brucella abortus bv. 5 str. B3196]|nr:flagellar motor switch protein G [Brucella abortus bv. 5 str. B3196]